MSWEILKSNCIKCKKCALCETRTQVVFGSGNPNAEVWVLGEAPGKNEDEQGLPFVGRSGKLLDEYLATIELNRNEDVFITNIVKCRPPKNRDPRPAERNACISWLENQLSLMRPKIVVCLGRIAAQIIIRKDFSVMKEHGSWLEKENVLYTATLHPAALMRYPKNKELVSEDFKAIKQKLEALHETK